MMNMTNTIGFNSNPLVINSANIGDSLSKNKQVSSNEFSNLLSMMMSSQTSLSGSSNSNGAIDLSSLIIILISKLFSDKATEDPSTLLIKSPNGTPLNGMITQESHPGHVALDFGVPIGTSVHSTMSGKVTYAGWNNEGYGNLVIVENGPYKTYYAHLSKIPVSIGQIVKEGSIIGLSGNTGNSTGPHLHYEVRKNGLAVDPATTI